MSAPPPGEPNSSVVSMVYPVGWITDGLAAEERVPAEGAESGVAPEPNRGENVSMVPLQSDESDEISFASFRSSPKSKRGSSGLTTSLGSNGLRTISLIAWNTLAAVGAVVIAIGPGPVLAARLAELGGLWAAVTAIVCLLTKRKA